MYVPYNNCNNHVLRRTTLLGKMVIVIGCFEQFLERRHMLLLDSHEKIIGHAAQTTDVEYWFLKQTRVTKNPRSSLYDTIQTNTSYDAWFNPFSSHVLTFRSLGTKSLPTVGLDTPKNPSSNMSRLCGLLVPGPKFSSLDIFGVDNDAPFCQNKQFSYSYWA